MRDANPEHLARLSALCARLPGTTRETGVQSEYTGHCTTFRVGKKVLVWYLVDHHNDGREAVWCKPEPGMQQALVASDGVRYFVPPYVGPKGWIGIRLDVGTVDWDMVEELIEQSFRLIAPKRLVAQLGSS